MKKVFFNILGYYTQFEQFYLLSKIRVYYIKPSIGGYTVYFHVKNIKDDSHAKEILNDFLSDNNISWGRHFISIEGKHRYHLT
jgi:hypothetical protein